MNSNCMKLEKEPPHFADLVNWRDHLNLKIILNKPKITYFNWATKSNMVIAEYLIAFLLG